MPPKVLVRPAAVLRPGVLARGVAKAKAKALAKAKAVAKPKAKGKARAKAKAGDPARRRRRDRSGDKGEEDEGQGDMEISELFKKGEEIEAGKVPRNLWQIGQKIIVTRGTYWEEAVDLVGVVKGLVVGEDQDILQLALEGSQAESLVKWAGLHPERRLEVHLCLPDCPRMAKEGLVHAVRVRLWSQALSAPWMDNLVAVRRGDPGEEDELRRLREEADRRERAKKKERARPGEEDAEAGRSSSSSRRARRKRKEKKKKEKKSKRKIVATKQLDQVFGTTALDPTPEVRKVLRKKARRAAKRRSKAKDTSSSSQWGHLQWERQLLRVGGPAFWRGGQGEAGLEKISRGFDIEHPGVHPISSGHPIRTTLGTGSQQSTSDFQPILEDGPDDQNGRSDVQRDSDPLLHPRSSPTGPGGQCLRRCDTEAEGVRTSGRRQPLPCQPETRTGPSGFSCHDVASGGNGSRSTAARGDEGQDLYIQAMGSATGLGEKGRRIERKRKEQGAYEGQGQDEDRSPRRVEGGQGQDKEDQLSRDWESGDSEKMRGAFSMSCGGDTPVRPPSAAQEMPVALGGLAGSYPPPSQLGPIGSHASFTIEGRTFSQMADHLLTMFNSLDVSLELSSSRIKCSGSVFPLPETRQGLMEVLGQDVATDSGVLVGLCKALNSYYGARREERPQATVARRMACQSLRTYAADSGLAKEHFQGLRWEDFMAVRSVDYRGEEVRLAKSFTWENIEPALPEGVGSIPLVEVCEGGTLDFVQNFEDYLIAEESRVYTKPPKIFVQQDSWERVCSGLLGKGVCTLVPRSEVFQVCGQPIFSGLFAVSKEEFQGSVEICRLIMNLVPINKLVRNLGGDVSTLPSITALGSVVLSEDEVMVMSSEDIKCFFYLFAVPPVWFKFLCFGREVPASVAPLGASEPFYLASRVLPMGFVGSVAIAQHIHRRIARLVLHSVKPQHGGQCELRRDKVFTSSSWLYRIYLDNFDALEKVDRKTAAVIRGEPSAEALAMRQGYLHWGLPRHPKKSVQQEVQAEIQGAWVDGQTGRVRPKPQKVMKYLELGWELLRLGKASQKQMQVVCGGFVYFCMFRRALLGLLNQVWRFIMSFEGDPPVIKRTIPPIVQFEMVRFMCAVPLAQMSLRTHMRGDVSVSDASEFGGGFCISKGLTPMGIHAAACTV